MTGRPTPILWYESPAYLCVTFPRSDFLPVSVRVVRVSYRPAWASLLTDFSFQNDVSEKEQRWGAKTVQGSGHQEHIK